MKNKNNKWSIRIPIFLSVALCIGILIGSTAFRKDTKHKGNIDENLYKIREVYTYLDHYYVDTVDLDKLTESAINHILETLDPHTSYIPKRDIEVVSADLKGNFEGVGIEFSVIRDTINVMATISGGPSESVGIKAGDKIIKVGDEVVAGIKIKNRGVIDRLRGKKGSKVKVGIQRRGESELLYYTITRDKIPTYTVDASYMLDNTSGYIKVNRFGATTYQEFYKALTNLKAQGMKRLVLDLRDNGGGYMDQAIKIADEFLPKNRKVVYTKGKVEQMNQSYETSSKGDFKKGEVIVLINEGSASASEIVTGALQDNDRALVVGRRSFGKGLVQRPIPLHDGSELRLTISRYYIPSGRCIQKPYDNIEDYHMDYINRYKHGEFYHKDSIKVDKSLEFKTVKGRKVYGGGGILPDVFIARDTTFYSKYWGDLRGNNVIREFALDYANEHKEALEKQTFDKYAKDFEITDKMIKSMVAHGEKLGVKYDDKGYQRSKDFLHIQLKALIARYVWKNDAFYPIYHQSDEMVKKAKTLFPEAKNIVKGKF